MKSGHLFICIFLILFSICFSGCLDNKSENQNESNYPLLNPLNKNISRLYSSYDNVPHPENPSDFSTFPI